jgi:uncharacterized protein YegJ (DUF2314 family)
MIGVRWIACLALAIAATPAVSADESSITYSQASDPLMNAAKRRGHDTLPEFWQHFEHPAKGESGFTVKFNLTPDSDAEFIWADNLERRDGKIFGRLSNEPLDDRFALDQTVEIPDGLIVDWGYFRNNVMQGNFTTRVQLGSMSREQAAQVKRALGW